MATQYVSNDTILICVGTLIHDNTRDTSLIRQHHDETIVINVEHEDKVNLQNGELDCLEKWVDQSIKSFRVCWSI